MIIDKSLLESFARSYNSLYETRAQLRTFSVGKRASVFLSHKHSEQKLVKEVRTILEELNAEVYIDWQDSGMPNVTSEETATRIKGKINLYDKFILIASQAAIDSKWCNWEIGYADSVKLSNEKMALFPIADIGRRWQGNEYLQLYPYIEYVIDDEYTFAGGGKVKRGFYVMSPDRSIVSLQEWLNK